MHLASIKKRLSLGFRRRISVGPISTSYSPRSSFAAAKAEAGDGYNDPRLGAVFPQTVLLTGLGDYVAAIVAAVSLAREWRLFQPIRVLDFGGGSGYIKAAVDQFFQLPAAAIEWSVVETPTQVAANNKADSARIRFATDFTPAPYDLAIFSGSLQYIDDWRSVLIKAAAAKLVLICRTPIAEVEEAFLQKVTRDDISFAIGGRVICEKELIAVLSQTHHLFASWNLDQHLGAMGVKRAPAMLWSATV